MRKLSSAVSRALLLDGRTGLSDVMSMKLMTGQKLYTALRAKISHMDLVREMTDLLWKAIFWVLNMCSTSHYIHK
jgi:hypothetical protein